MRLDVADLGDRSREVPVGELRCQLRLQHDDRERVAEQVVQVAADALALGDARHLFDRLLRHAQLVVLAPHLGEVDVRIATIAPTTTTGAQPATGQPSAQQSSAMTASISSSHGADAFADAVGEAGRTPRRR